MHYQVTNSEGKPVSGLIYDLTYACERANELAIRTRQVVTLSRYEIKPQPKVTKLATYDTDGGITLH